MFYSARSLSLLLIICPQFQIIVAAQITLVSASVQMHSWGHSITTIQGQPDYQKFGVQGIVNQAWGSFTSFLLSYFIF